MVKILQTPTFKRAIKRLHKQEKQELDKAIRTIATAPNTGEAKMGDLAGVRVHKFKMNKQLTLLAYEPLADTIKLLALGSHENFYRDLKR
ncbi:type II toxin-antitoxin system RelE/ParE family toxin [Terasakiella sp.]|uniref:type II toxin-antitoxin system RelE/ParE family toxin n=1 Tax=Terasakiella sp. TaxID=2034861 RepID=UPI003AA8EC8E